MSTDTKPRFESARRPLSNCRSGKRKYADEREARTAMRYTRKMRKGQSGHLPANVYACLSCDGWHMTSQRSGTWKPVHRSTPISSGA